MKNQDGGGESQGPMVTAQCPPNKKKYIIKNKTINLRSAQRKLVTSYWVLPTKNMLFDVATLFVDCQKSHGTKIMSMQITAGSINYKQRLQLYPTRRAKACKSEA